MITCKIMLHNIIVEVWLETNPLIAKPFTENTARVVPDHLDPILHHPIASMHQNHMELCQETSNHCLMHNIKIHNWMAQGRILKTWLVC